MGSGARGTIFALAPPAFGPLRLRGSEKRRALRAVFRLEGAVNLSLSAFLSHTLLAILLKSVRFAVRIFALPVKFAPPPVHHIETPHLVFYVLSCSFDVLSTFFRRSFRLFRRSFDVLSTFFPALSTFFRRSFDVLSSSFLLFRRSFHLTVITIDTLTVSAVLSEFLDSVSVKICLKRKQIYL